MKILLCNNTLSLLAGSETAVFSLASELKKRGHEITAFSENLGQIAVKMQDIGIEVVDGLDGRQNDFDVAFCNHFAPTNIIKAKCPNLPIIFTIHGIIGGPETPPLYCDAFVAVSEEVRDLMKEKYEIECEIIRNGVDFDRFSDKKPRNEKIKSILFSTSYVNKNSEVFKAVWNAARIINAEMHATGRDHAWIWEMEEIYNKVDLVVTLGRGCLEAMACNRPALVLGHWGRNQDLSADGIVTKESIAEIRKNNFSSRRFRKDWKVKDIVEELQKYDATTNFRELIQPDHDIKITTDKYLDIANRIISKL